jgi:hypothetical protein
MCMCVQVDSEAGAQDTSRKARTYHEAGENYIMKSFVIVICHQITIMAVKSGRMRFLKRLLHSGQREIHNKINS